MFTDKKETITPSVNIAKLGNSVSPLSPDNNHPLCSHCLCFNAKSGGGR